MDTLVFWRPTVIDVDAQRMVTEYEHLLARVAANAGA